MEIFVHRLLSELIAGNGSRLVSHYDLDKTVLPQAQYETVFSEENTVIHFEHELIKIERPLGKNIFLVGSMSSEERPMSYSMPIRVTAENKESGETYEVDTHDNAVEFSCTVRISMIAGHETVKQSYAQLRYMQLFAMQSLRNPPTQNWYEWPAHLMGFTTVWGIHHENLAGFSEELLRGKWFGALFKEFIVPSEHVIIEKL